MQFPLLQQEAKAYRKVLKLLKYTANHQRLQFPEG